jgi:hypothetical protein
MTQKKEEDRLFATAIDNSVEVTDFYTNRLALIKDILGDSKETGDNFNRIIRNALENDVDVGTLGTFADLPTSVIDEVKQWHQDGLIGAVDGTAAINQTILADKIVFGVAIATLTSRSQGEPKLTYTRTMRPQLIGDMQGILDLETAIEKAREANWTQAYREFYERRAAIDLAANNGCRLVLIDGPIYTRHLLTQQTAIENVLNIIQRDPHIYVGYIKELKPFHKQLGASLKSGEYWISKQFMQSIVYAFDSSHISTKWISQSKPWTRCIYKLKLKPFEFECDPGIIPYALALLTVDCSNSINHEIPFLLELVDKHARAKSDAANIAKDLIASTGEQAIALENESEFRL